MIAKRPINGNSQFVVWLLMVGVVVTGGLSVRADAPPDRRDLNVRTSRVTGLASFVTVRGGGPIRVELPQGRTHAEPMDFLVQYKDLFGITAPAEQLVESRRKADSLGYTHTTYEQVHKGVPVFSGVLKVHQDATGAIVAANGDFYPITPKLRTTPTIDTEAALRVARSRLFVVAPTVTRSDLVIVDPGWYGDPAIGERLAYYIILEDAAAGVREAFFVDAHSGTLLDQWSMVDAARDRRVYDAMQTSQQGTLVRSEGEPPVSSPQDVNFAYDYGGDVYDYYDRAFGRDAIDDEGSPLLFTVNWYVSFLCPNAFWNGVRMTFCDGTVTDDITAHEMTHGVTEYTANLVYQNQSGQLNESYSDVFGELIDLFNGNAAFPGPPGGSPSWPTHPTGPGQDSPNNLRTACSLPPSYPNGVRWLAGEDADAFGGAIRDMWMPTCFGDPDRANSPLQICHPADSGGVHSGSGVPNHAFAILTDGKTFNGFTVTGIGPIKAGAVWYRALTTYLTSASDFQEAYAALNQAAADLIGFDPNDPRSGLPSGSVFTADDAEQVDRALRAVEMDTVGLCGDEAVLNIDPPQQCAGSVTLFADDFENGVNGWTVSHSGPGGTYDWVQTDDLPRGREGTAWFCEDRDTACTGVNANSLHSLITPTITLPPKVHFPTLAFTHSVAVEPGYDGGNLSISVNGAPFQPLPYETFGYNPYNFVPLLGAPSTCPLAGQPAFSGHGGEWGTTVAHLGSFASGGDSVRIRFDFGKDECAGRVGWYVDDFEIYDCDIQDCNNNGIDDSVEVQGGPQLDVIIRQLPNHDADFSDPSGPFPAVLAESFALNREKTIESVKLWGAYYPSDDNSSNHFRVIFHANNGGYPGSTLSSQSNVPAALTATGGTLYGLTEWEIELTLPNPVTLDAGIYFVEIYNDTVESPDTFIWESADYIGVPGNFYSPNAPGGPWFYGFNFNLSLEIIGGVIGGDCNNNAIPDDCEADCDGNARPDDCDIDECPPGDASCADCNANGLLDICEFNDCNENSIPDDCDIAFGTSEDCNGDSVPDECGTDCNANGVADVCDFLDGTLNDNNGNGIADECETVFVDAGNVGGPHDGMSWNTAYLDLQEALTGAAESGGIVQEIWVVAGTYTPAPPGGMRTSTFRIPDGVKVYGGFSGSEIFASERDPIANVTTLSGDLSGNDGADFANYGDNVYHVVTISDEDGSHVDTVVDGFVVRGGNANGVPPNFFGAGLYIDGGAPTIARCTFTLNTAFTGGGLHSESADPAIHDCTFLHNEADSGGGMSTAGAGTPLMFDCLFQENEGGGMQNSDHSAPVLIRTEFRGNTNNSGGAGMYNSNQSKPNMTLCRFVDNVSQFGDGGGVYSKDGSDVFAVHCTFENNRAFSRGGGMYNFNNNAALVNCAFIDNHVDDLFSLGGGLFHSAGAATITNGTFHGNSAAGDGGGIYYTGSGGTITVSNTILWDNVHGSPGTQGAQLFVAAGSASVNYSCIEGLTGSLGGTGNIGADPGFIDAAAGNLRLNANSPCSDAGNNLADVDAATPGVQPLPQTDLDGNFRLFDNPNVPNTGNGTSPIVDMGAWEYQLCTAPIIGTDPTDQGGCLGGSATFQAIAIGTQPVTYQWRKDGSEIVGATGDSYTVAPIDADDAGQYDVVAGNDCGSVTSQPAALIIVSSVPTITVHPLSQGGCAGQDVTLTVEAESEGPVTYQWRKNLAVIPGANDGSYTIESFDTGDVGTYDVRVTNGCGSATSNPAILTIGTEPTVTAHPGDVTTCAGGSATFAVVTTGTGPLSYQWRHDGEDVTGANSATLVIEPVAPQDAGQYDVLVGNPCGSDTSDSATLTVDPAIIGDFDGDCAVTIEDYRAFQDMCLSGDHTAPDFTPPAPQCLRFDSDGDADVDLLDFGVLQDNFGE